MSEDDEPMPGYSLVMPFVVCASNGGPYDDNSFVAGVVFATHQGLLEHAHPETGRSVEPGFPVFNPLVPQLDLLAMSHGFSLVAEPVEGMEDEWTQVTYTPMKETQT